MYLISAYFDDAAAHNIQQYIRHTAQKTGNSFMLENGVPPHITISSFQTKRIEQVIECLQQKALGWEAGTVQWVSAGVFFPHVIYLTPVINSYLHSLSLDIDACLTQLEDILISPYYRPFSWIPHTTIGKTLSPEEMQTAFQVLQSQFGVFSGQITRIGLAKTNPYRNLAVFELTNKADKC